MLVMPPMLFHRERVNEVRLLVYYISSLKATLHAYTELSITNQRLYLLSQLKAQGLPSDSLQIIFHALILSKVEYAFPAIAELLSETWQIKARCFFRKAKRRGLSHSEFCLSVTTGVDVELFQRSVERVRLHHCPRQHHGHYLHRSHGQRSFHSFSELCKNG